MTHDEYADLIKLINKNGEMNAKLTPVPKGQKFKPNTLVFIAKKLGASKRHFNMDHFEKGVPALVRYTYAHAYPHIDKDNVKSYCLLVRVAKNNWYEISWYYEHQLTEITNKKRKSQLLRELNKCMKKEK